MFIVCFISFLNQLPLDFSSNGASEACIARYTAVCNNLQFFENAEFLLLGSLPLLTNSVLPRLIISAHFQKRCVGNDIAQSELIVTC